MSLYHVCHIMIALFVVQTLYASRADMRFEVSPVYSNSRRAAVRSIGSPMPITIFGGSAVRPSVGVFAPATPSMISMPQMRVVAPMNNSSALSSTIYEPFAPAPMMRSGAPDDFDPGGTGGFDAPGEIGKFPLDGEWLLIVLAVLFMFLPRQICRRTKQSKQKGQFTI